MARTRIVRDQDDDGDAYVPPPVEAGKPPPLPPLKPPKKKRKKPKPAPVEPVPDASAGSPLESPIDPALIEGPVPDPPPTEMPDFDFPFAVEPNLPPLPPPPPQFTSADARLLESVIAELSQRQFEALRLYKPLPKLAEFHATNVHTRLVIGSNRSGKTLISAAEFSRAVTGQDPFFKYPTENGVAFVFGNDEYHLGSVCYTKLFRAGAFKMLKDGDEWRLFDPVADAARRGEAKPAPPLIPNRFLEPKGTVWIDKGSHVPKLIRLRNGWEIHFFSALGSLPRGQDIDLWWADEEFKRKDLIEEVHARCLDRAGSGFWSCTPQASTTQLYDLHEKAQKKDPSVREFFAKLLDNPYITDEEKIKFYNALSDEARRVRYHGEFALSRFSVYPEFNLHIHSWDESAKPITERWSRWLVIDPGRQRCAVLFGAVAPPEVRQDCVVAYDELYIENCTAQEMARQVALKSRGIVYEGGIVDMRAARVHEMGMGKTVKDQYERALWDAGVEFRGGGKPSLGWACDDVDAGVERVKEWLRVRQNGKPYFFICPDKLQSLQWEISRYRNAADPKTGMPMDKPVQKNNHLVDCWRYLALLDPQWSQPEKPARRRSGVVAMLERERQRESKKGGRDVVIRLGCGGTE